VVDARTCKGIAKLMSLPATVTMVKVKGKVFPSTGLGGP
jgi:hypothetical protein